MSRREERKDRRDRSPKRRRRERSPKNKRKRSGSPQKDKRAFTPPEEVEERMRKEAGRTKEREKEKMSKMAASISSSERREASQKVPISVTEFAEKIRDAEEKNSRPVFASKEERQRQAVQRRQEEVEAQRQRLEEERGRRAALLEEMRSERSAEQSHKRPPNKLLGKLGKAPEEGNVGDTEMEKIRKEHLGIKERKKRVLKASEKMKFVFGWSASDDTSKDGNPLYDNKVISRPLFGRGFVGGIDEQEQYKMFGGKDDKRRREKVKSLGAMQDEKHWSEKRQEEMAARDWRIFREDFHISTKGGSIPLPMRSWEESTLPEELIKAIKAVGYKKPTPIQMQAIPIGLENRDILGIAETGSGKTASFVLPMLAHISKLARLDSITDGPYAIVLAPTRELAQQIEQETVKFASYLGIRCLGIIGGASIEEQSIELRNPFEIIIATPGRLIDCIDRRFMVLNQCNYVVLDEADRMIDNHFEEQIVRIFESMPLSLSKSADENEALEQEKQAKENLRQYRTTIMYSATMPVAVERLARKYLRHAAYITVGMVGRAVERIKQHVHIVKSEHEKKTKMAEIMKRAEPPVIVFVARKTTAKTVNQWLCAEGFKSVALHSGKKQDQREEAIEGIKSGKYGILVATNVAGRGIDIPDVSHVVNYDCPISIQEYIHKIGRTGRAGEHGEASTFLTSNDSSLFYDLKKVLQETNNHIPIELQEMDLKPTIVPTTSNRLMKDTTREK